MFKFSALAAALALTPFAVQAAAISWTGGAGTSVWGTGTNWNTGVAPVTTSAVTIGNTANNPVQITTPVSLNGSTGALTIGTGVGSTESVNITSTGSLNMGARPITLLGGSITGQGGVTATGSISGYGTISAPITGTSFTANSTNGTFGVPGASLNLVNQTLSNDSFTISRTGNFNLSGVTLSGTTTLSGVSNNLQGNGNNYYGLISVTGDSTLSGTINNTNYQEFKITGSTLHLSNVTISNGWATNVPAIFVVGAGGTLDNTAGNNTLPGPAPINLLGGRITNSDLGTFTINSIVSGYGSVSGPVNLGANGAFLASGGTLTVDATTGAVNTGSSHRVGDRRWCQRCAGSEGNHEFPLWGVLEPRWRHGPAGRRYVGRRRNELNLYRQR